MSECVLAVIELDNSAEEVAGRAAWLARLYGHDLHLMLSDPSISVLRDSFIVSNEAKEIAASIETAQIQMLDDIAESIRAGGDIQIATTVSHDRPAHHAIISQALELEPSFVVKGTAYRSAAERASFTHTDWQLIRKLDVPLWLVKPDSWEDEPTVVAAVDPTHRHDKEGVLDQAIVEIAKSLTERCGGELILLHTYERLVEIGRYATFKFKPVKLPIDELEENIKNEHRQKLDALAAANDIAGDAVHQLPGRTEEILPMFARAQGANVVVMGALARSGLAKRTLGSTAERVLDHLHCDILIARGK